MRRGVEGGKPMEEIIKMYCHMIDFGVKISRQETASDREDTR
jgi:hypothetical protein